MMTMQNDLFVDVYKLYSSWLIDRQSLATACLVQVITTTSVLPPVLNLKDFNFEDLREFDKENFMLIQLEFSNVKAEQEMRSH